MDVVESNLKEGGGQTSKFRLGRHKIGNGTADVSVKGRSLGRRGIKIRKSV